MSVQPSAGAGSLNISQRAGFPAELTATMSGSFVEIGTLSHIPRLIIFDNQGTASVAISVDAVNTWRTFTPGEALVLDLATNQASAPSFGIDMGTTFYGNGASGTFSISYLYAVP